MVALGSFSGALTTSEVRSGSGSPPPLEGLRQRPYRQPTEVRRAGAFRGQSMKPPLFTYRLREDVGRGRGNSTSNNHGAQRYVSCLSPQASLPDSTVELLLSARAGIQLGAPSSRPGFLRRTLRLWTWRRGKSHPDLACSRLFSKLFGEGAPGTQASTIHSDGFKSNCSTHTTSCFKSASLVTRKTPSSHRKTSLTGFINGCFAQ